MAKKINSLPLFGLFGGLLVAIVIWNLPIPNLPPDGQKCLALSLMAVCWWATRAMHPGFAALALLVSYALFLSPTVAPSSLIFSLWTNPLMYLVIGGFLIAEAVQCSGLGERIALHFIHRFVKSYQGVIVSCYVLGAILSLIIPHPWPRNFLLLSVMTYIIRAAKLSEQYAANIGLAIFAGAIPTSMILLTGDSSLNTLMGGFAGASISYLQWLLYMGLPGLLTSALTCFAQLKLFGAPTAFNLDMEEIEEKIAQLGKLDRKEIICIAVLILAIAGWMTDSLHGIHSGWVAMVAVFLLCLPFTHVLGPQSWSTLHIGTLFFLCAALAIGTVGNATGMNTWIASVFIPQSVSDNPYLFAVVACAICMGIHLFLGSTLAVLGIAAPAIISFGAMAGLNPVAASLITYTAVAAHWLLPLHQMTILVGTGENGGKFGEKAVLKLGAVQTIIIFAICLFEICWWKWIGLL